MKIISTKIKSFKAIKDFEANIEGKNVYLVGENGLGKSSFMQFISIALGDTKHIPENFKGEGVVIATKEDGEYTFKVTEKGGKPVIEVTNPQGLRDKSKGMLHSITGAIDFDIDEFVRLSSSKAGQKKQVEIFKSFLGEEIVTELNKYEAHVKALYDERTEVNKEAKEYNTKILTHPLRNEMDLTKFKPVDLTQEFALLNQTNEKNGKLIESKGRLDAAINECKVKQDEITYIENEIEKLMQKKINLEAEVKAKNEKIAEHKKFLEENPIQDTSAIQETIETASAINKKYEQAQELIKLVADHNKIVEQAGDLTAKIESERQLIQDTIRQMESPVEGLSFEEDVLMYNGIEVNENNLSTSQIMELGVKMKIAENKDFGVLFLSNTNLIGNERWKLIKDIAKANNMQIFAEEVRRGLEELKVEIMEG